VQEDVRRKARVQESPRRAEELCCQSIGVSAQPLEDQKEAKARLELPFELLNDGDFALAEAMRLPTFEYNRLRLIKRFTVIAINGIIRKVFYPVCPPNRNAEDVLGWFKSEGI